MSDFTDLDLDATLRGFRPSQRVFDRYILKSVIGRGGMGVVWLAEDTVLERDVALKFLPELIVRDKVAVADLKREATRSLGLTHANIVRVFDFLLDTSRELAAISMEYVDGDNLSNLRADREHRCFEVEELRPIVAQLCDALSYAHEKAKVVHRDLKPANLMLTKAGELKITDFGIAASIGDSASRISARRAASGTLAYMSPQQASGSEPSPSDDIYSLGATIYDLLCGHPPFHRGDIFKQVQSNTAASLKESCNWRDKENGQIPENWDRAVLACLEKAQTERPVSVRELAGVLGLRIGGKDCTVKREETRHDWSVPQTRGDSPKRLRVIALVVLFMAAALAAFHVFTVARTAFSVSPPGSAVTSDLAVPDLRNTEQNVLPAVVGPSFAKVSLSGAMSKDMVTIVKRIADDGKSSGVLLEIDSIGGELTSVESLRAAIEELKRKKRVVAHIRGTCNAGAYYVASAADYIIGEEWSTVGGIGLFIKYPMGSEVATFMTGQFIAGPMFKMVDAITPENAPQLSMERRSEIQALVMGHFERMLAKISAARSVPLDKLRESVGDGRTQSAKNALSLGLIDEIGSEAIASKKLSTLCALKEGEGVSVVAEQAVQEDEVLRFGVFYMMSK